MPQIMQPYVGKLGRATHPAPYLAEPDTGAAVAAPANHIRIAGLARQVRQHFARNSSDHRGFAMRRFPDRRRQPDSYCRYIDLRRLFSDT
jgi:hypothetical protein